MSTRTAVTVLATAVLAACIADDPAPSNGSEQRHEQLVETRGDTTVVRTLSGSVWGADATLVPEFAIGELDGLEEYLFRNNPLFRGGRLPERVRVGHTGSTCPGL